MNYCAAFIPPLLKNAENKNYLWDLRAPDQKYRESHDRSEISYFILFHQKYLFGKLFSKIIIKSSSAFWFFQNYKSSKYG